MKIGKLYPLTFTSTVTQNTCKINHQFNCSKKCLVYLLTCNKCFKQYIGQIVDEFRRRWNYYKSNDRNFQRLEPCMQEHLFSHSHNGFLNDISITFTDTTDPSYPLRREDYWRKTLKTMVPYRVNIEDSVCFFFFVCVCLLFYMSACFKDYDFGITEFVLSVYIVASGVVSVYIHKKSTREECSPDNIFSMLD